MSEQAEQPQPASTLTPEQWANVEAALEISRRYPAEFEALRLRLCDGEITMAEFYVLARRRLSH